MKITVLGSCSGTEPHPGRRYTAWVLEKDDGELLWFDAGGGCASTAYEMGLNPLRIGAIFLSHPHLDHTAGLPELFQTIVKERWLRRQSAPHRLRFYAPVREVLHGALLLVEEDAAGAASALEVTEFPLAAGELYRDADLSVEALPNAHMPPRDGVPRSWSFRLCCGEYRIVYTGDIRSLDEIAPWLAEGCDLLMLETGHHRAAELCRELKEKAVEPGELLFLHHGVEILADPAGEKAKADAARGRPVLFAADRMVLVPKLRMSP